VVSGPPASPLTEIAVEPAVDALEVCADPIERLREPALNPPLGHRKLVFETFELFEIRSEGREVGGFLVEPIHLVGGVPIRLGCLLVRPIRLLVRPIRLLVRPIRLLVRLPVPHPPDVQGDVSPGGDIEVRGGRVGAFRAELVGGDVHFEPEVAGDREVLPAAVVDVGFDQPGLLELPEVVDDRLRAHAEILADLRDVAGLPREQS